MRQYIQKRSILAGVGTAALMLGSLLPVEAARAQDAATASEYDESEILVTARKRRESLLEIPESIVALSAETIERANIRGLEDIGFAIPNLSLSVRTDGFPNVAIRGIGSFGNTQGVGFYLDDVQLFVDASSRFGDMDRIEVLKGPQGTLYGGSNIGGAVRFVATRPDAKEFSGSVKGMAGGQNIREWEGSLNIPLDQDWAIRLFGFTNSDNGFLFNNAPARLNGGRTAADRNLGRSEESGARVAIAGKLTPDFSVYGSLRWSNLDAPNNPWGRELDNDFEHSRERNFSFNPRLTRETFAGTLELNYDFGAAELTSVSSYTDTALVEQMDLDITPEFIVDLNRPNDYEILTQEVRLTSTGSGPFKWLAGLYYLQLKQDTDAKLSIYDSADVIGGGGIPTALQEQTATVIPFEDRLRDRKQYAAFINASYRLGMLEIGAGFRIDHWNVFAINRDSGFDGVQSKTEFLPRVSLAWYLDDNDTNIYANFSRGFEPGGFNLSNFAGANELFGFNAEKTSNYELGFKGQFFDRAVTFTAAAFYIDYTSRQFELQTTDPISGNIVEGILNAGNSRQWGAEFDINWKVTRELALGLSGGFVEAEWKQGTVLNDGTDISGLRPPYMQTANIAGNISYEKQLNDDWGIQARAQFSHNGRFQIDLPNNFQNPAQTLVNARLGVKRRNVEVALNVENLFNTAYYTDATLFPSFDPLLAQPSIIIGTLGQPRLVTGSISVRF